MILPNQFLWSSEPVEPCEYSCGDNNDSYYELKGDKIIYIKKDSEFEETILDYYDKYSNGNE